MPFSKGKIGATIFDRTRESECGGSKHPLNKARKNLCVRVCVECVRWIHRLKICEVQQPAVVGGIFLFEPFLSEKKRQVNLEDIHPKWNVSCKLSEQKPAVRITRVASRICFQKQPVFTLLCFQTLWCKLRLGQQSGWTSKDQRICFLQVRISLIFTCREIHKETMKMMKQMQIKATCKFPSAVHLRKQLFLACSTCLAGMKTFDCCKKLQNADVISLEFFAVWEIKKYPKSTLATNTPGQQFSRVQCKTRNDLLSKKWNFWEIHWAVVYFDDLDVLTLQNLDRLCVQDKDGKETWVSFFTNSVKREPLSRSNEMWSKIETFFEVTGGLVDQIFVEGNMLAWNVHPWIQVKWESEIEIAGYAAKSAR